MNRLTVMSRPIIIAFLLVAAATTSLVSQETTDSGEPQRPTRVLVSVSVATEEVKTDDPLRVVIKEAVLLELRIAGLEAFAVAEQGTGSPDFRIDSIYRSDGEEITVDIQCLDGKDDVIASTTLYKRITLSFDSQIQKIVSRDILPAIPPTMAMTRKEIRTVEKAAAAALAAETAANEVQEELTVENRFGRESRPWRLQFGYAPFIATGEASEFLDIGHESRIFFGYAFGVGKMEIVPGIFVGGLYVVATGSLASTQNLFIPAGISVSLNFPGPLLTPYVRLGGGIATLMVLGGGAGTQTKIIPYGEGAVGAEFAFGKVFGLAIDVAFQAYLENSLIILGFAPGLMFSFRF